MPINHYACMCLFSDEVLIAYICKILIESNTGKCTRSEKLSHPRVRFPDFALFNSVLLISNYREN